MIELPAHRRIVIAIALVILAVATSLRAQENPNSTKPSGASITGKLVMREGSPFNARVSVFRLGSSNLQIAITVDEDGNFKTEPLAPGIYTVSANVPGYITDFTQSPTNYYRPGDTATITISKGGVITGVVKDANNQPIVNIAVRATRVRDAEGKALPGAFTLRGVITDDRGVYRIFGLPAGSYVVSAGGPQRPASFGPASPSPFENLAPTYAPSATRDTALEVAVTGGDEATADITYRNDSGHAVSGVINGANVPETGNQTFSITISLFDLGHHNEFSNTAVLNSKPAAFAVYGVPDGEYELYASQFSAAGEQMTTPPKRVKVQGADATGINLTLAPQASVEGRLVLESDPKAACGKRPKSALQESLVSVRRQPDQKPSTSQPKAASQIDVPYALVRSGRTETADANGRFSARNLAAGAYWIDPREPGTGWYLKSIRREVGPHSENIPRAQLDLKTGERASGVLVTISDGAARLSGHLSGEPQGVTKLRAYLVPADREAADNVLRFYESTIDRDGSFTVDNVAPGRYFLIARKAEENEMGVTRLVRSDEALRTAILKEAEAQKKAIAFKPCQQVNDFDLPFVPPQP